jgi:hypothetical protein
VKIEKVEINTQATDAKGIAASISSELSSILSNIHGNIDDGQKA